MCEQMRSLDWHTRGAKLIAAAPSPVLDAVLNRIDAILFA